MTIDLMISRMAPQAAAIQDALLLSVRKAVHHAWSTSNPARHLVEKRTGVHQSAPLVSEKSTSEAHAVAKSVGVKQIIRQKVTENRQKP